LNRALQGLAEEIARSLVQEVESCRVVAKPASAGVVDLLLPQLAEEVVRQLGTVNRTTDSFSEDFEDRLLEVERKLKKLALGLPDIVEDVGAPLVIVHHGAFLPGRAMGNQLLDRFGMRGAG